MNLLQRHQIPSGDRPRTRALLVPSIVTGIIRTIRRHDRQEMGLPGASDLDAVEVKFGNPRAPGSTRG